MGGWWIQRARCPSGFLSAAEAGARGDFDADGARLWRCRFVRAWKRRASASPTPSRVSGAFALPRLKRAIVGADFEQFAVFVLGIVFVIEAANAVARPWKAFSKIIASMPAAIDGAIATRARVRSPVEGEFRCDAASRRHARRQDKRLAAARSLAVSANNLRR